MINAIKSCPLPRELRGHFLTGHPLRGPKPQDYAAAARNLARKPTSPRRAPGRPQACYCLPPGPWPTPWPTPRAIPGRSQTDPRPQADPRLAEAYPQAPAPLPPPPERSLTDPRPTPQADPPGRPPPRPTPQAHPLAHPESDAGPIPRRPQAPGPKMRGFLKGGVAAEDGGKWSPLATGG